jgi:hypothetical protein
MSAPRVLSMKQCPGRDAPDGAVYIGDRRNLGGYRLARSKWANPFKIDKADRSGRITKKRDGTRAEVIAKYRAWICDQPDLLAALPELRGHDLVCWCASLFPPAVPCHGDVLLELANGGAE